MKSTGTTFGATFFKLTNLHDEQYDVILGTPFLKKHELDVSVSRRCVVQTKKGKVWFESELKKEKDEAEKKRER